jgi:bacterioferritin-associated ferredoxin
MYICICHAITEKDIDQAVCKGGQSLRDLRKELNLGTECGLCADAARQCLSSALKKKAAEGRKSCLIAA